MKQRKQLSAGFWWLIVPLVLCAVAYPFLPSQIPRQFHADGTVSYMAKELLFMLALIPFLIYLVKRKK